MNAKTGIATCRNESMAIAAIATEIGETKLNIFAVLNLFEKIY